MYYPHYIIHGLNTIYLKRPFRTPLQRSMILLVDICCLLKYSSASVVGFAMGVSIHGRNG